MAYPSTVAEIEAGLGALAAEFPRLCTRSAAPNRSHEGRTITSVRVTAAGDGGRPVVFNGGAHAREWVPPDALLTLVERLLRAYDAEADLVIPAFTDTAPNPDIVYAEARVAAADVQRILDGVELHVLALLNPDGRLFSQSSPLNALWRKNRRAAAPGTTCRGVDLNRNHDIAWDFERYYDANGEAVVSVSADPCDFQVYHGPAPASEPEARNLVSLLRATRAEYYVDVHSFSRKLLFPWGMDSNQSTNPEQTFRNPVWDDRRDGEPGGPYGEFIAAADVSRHERVGAAMRDAMIAGAGADPRARARSAYDSEPSLALYPTTGSASDFAFSLQFDADGPPTMTSFTLECGNDTDGEGGFQPLPRIYPKIEREVHLALLAMLLDAAG